MPLPPSTSRRLGSFERAEALTGRHFAYNLVVALRLARAPADGDLRRALDAVRERHALLRSRIVGRGRRARFEGGSVPAIPVRPMAADEDGWRAVVESELASPFDVARGPLARCVTAPAPDGERRDLVLTLHHAVVDAEGCLELVRRIVASLAGEEGPAAAPAGLPPSPDAGFPAAYRAPRCWPASARFLLRELGGELAYRRRTRGFAAAPASGPFRCRTLSVTLPEDETEALVRASRRERVGLTAALDAAMLLAVARRRYGGRELPYRYFAFPLLRPYLRPPVPPEVFASYTGIIRLTLGLSGATDPWTLAARIHRQIDAAVKRGDRFLAARWSAFSMRTLFAQRARRMSTVALNYAGAVPGDLEPAIEELHAFVTNFPLGPEYTAQTRIFRRRLCWDVVYLDVDMDRDEALAIVEDARETLARAAERPGREAGRE